MHLIFALLQPQQIISRHRDNESCFCFRYQAVPANSPTNQSGRNLVRGHRAFHGLEGPLSSPVHFTEGPFDSRIRTQENDCGPSVKCAGETSFSRTLLYGPIHFALNYVMTQRCVSTFTTARYIFVLGRNVAALGLKKACASVRACACKCAPSSG